MGDETPSALVPGMRALDHPALGLDGGPAGDGLGPQRLLRVAPGAGAAGGGLAGWRATSTLSCGYAFSIACAHRPPKAASV